MNTTHDEITSYCRSLGHYVPFRYCRTVNEGIPCRKIRDCWFERMDIESYMNENYSESERERISAPQPEKIFTIIDLINKAKGNK